MKIRTWIAGLLGAGLLAAGMPAAPASAAVVPLPKSVTSCSGVWVVVQRAADDTAVRCATKYATGLEALRSAGFVPDTKTSSYGEFVQRVNGFPETLDTTYTNYWGYWHASPKADGSWDSWTSYDVGASDSKPVKGAVEGWVYGGYSPTATIVLPPLGYAKKATPRIAGHRHVGAKLTAKPGSWSPQPRFSYQWYRNGSKVAHATKASYKLKRADRGKQIRVKITVRLSGHQTVTVFSAHTKKISR